MMKIGVMVMIIWVSLASAADYYLSEDLEMVKVDEASKVSVEVYYEVLCPDSRYFVLHQLYPTWQKVSEIMDIQLKPYGKASHKAGPRGMEFQCQHGPTECEGNKVHACAAQHIGGKGSKLIEYIRCMIADNYDPIGAGKKCADELDIDFGPIQRCASDREGSELLASIGDDTHSLRPKVTFIPTIQINGSQMNQRSILKNLLKEVCQAFKGKRPKNCIEVL